MILSGTKASQVIQAEIKERVSALKRKPHLAVVLVGEHAPSHSYVRAKKKACAEVGITFSLHTFDANVQESHLIAKLEELNASSSVDGILVQSPLPSSLSYNRVISALDPQKDVDGFHPLNMGKLLLGLQGFVPCTPLGIKVLLEKNNVPFKGKRAVIVGRSGIVGKPLAALLMQKGVDCTVTVAHSQTENLSEVTQEADLLIAAVGRPHFITAPMVKKGAIVIDVGINRVNEKLVGDVDFDRVQPLASALTPVPGGVGPMTVAMLLHNTLASYESRH